MFHLGNGGIRVHYALDIDIDINKNENRFTINTYVSRW